MSETQRYAPVAMNGAYTMNAKCESKKKPFTSEVEAVEFEKWNRETNGYQRQYAYKCEDCPDWHLTSTPPGAATMARTNYSAIANLNPIREKGETKAKVRELASQGLKAKEIAERLTISTAAVYSHLRDNPAKSAPTLVTLDSIAEKKKQLEAELLKLHEQEQRLIDLKSLKIVRCWEGKGILISKEGGSVALSIDDCEELVIRIDDMLKSAQQN